MNRVLPKISSGEFDLLLTESLCFNPLEGLIINIPTSNENTGLPGRDITFEFVFKYDGNPSNNVIKTSLNKNQVEILLNNFGSALISGILNPLTFQFGKVPIKLYFSGMLIEDQDKKLRMINFTVSIYQGKI